MSAARACRAHALSAAHAFRLGAEAHGHDELALLVDALARHVTAAPETAASLSPLLPEIVAAQTRGDTLRLADLLEHVLLPALG